MKLELEPVAGEMADSAELGLARAGKAFHTPTKSLNTYYIPWCCNYDQDQHLQLDSPVR